MFHCFEMSVKHFGDVSNAKIRTSSTLLPMSVSFLDSTPGLPKQSQQTLLQTCSQHIREHVSSMFVTC